MLRFRSRIALWILRAALVLALMFLLGELVFEAGGCTIGLTQQGSCTHIPTWIGDIALFTTVAGYVLSLYVAPVLIIVAGCMEFLARQR